VIKRIFLLTLLLCCSLSAWAQQRYYETDPEACLNADFSCPAGQYPFFDQKGCGCYTPSPSTCRTSDAGAESGGFMLTASSMLDDDNRYLNRDPLQCRQLQFECAEGYYPFFDQQGCGCAAAALERTYCPQLNARNLYTVLTHSEPYYISNDVATCNTLKFRCKEQGFYPFFDQQGCGCRAQICPPDDSYFISRQVEDCQRTRFQCRDGFQAFFSDYGCGCVPVITTTE